jgi:hypothetical protein
MAPGNQRTDHMPMAEFRRRANERAFAGWTHTMPAQVVAITPVFDPDFNVFAAKVAHELRFYIVYRSDGGHFARGLVRSTTELEKIHAELKRAGYPAGQKVTIAAALYRRVHAEPTSRWMMSIRFGRVAIDVQEAERVTASAQVTANSDAYLGSRLLDITDKVALEPSWTGDRKKRLGDWAALARKLGYPKYLDLWYYNRALVARYIQIQYVNERKAMSGGKPPPFDGRYGVEEWRIYPFRYAFNDCKKRQGSFDDCYQPVANQLALAEREIFAQIDEVYKAAVKTAGALGQDLYDPGTYTNSPDTVYGTLAPFLRDFAKRLRDPDTVYGAFTKYSQVKPGFWEQF